MFEYKNSNHREKYKPSHWIYIAMIIVFTVIRCIPTSCGSANLDDAFNDLAVGAIASTVVAWLIDVATCRQKNKELQEKARMVFAEYCSAVNDLGYFVARRCQKFSQPTDELPLNEWLNKLTDSTNYPPNIPSVAMIERTYFYITAYIRNIKGTLVSLRQQYCMLVESDIIDTDDFRQHAALQLRICDDICDLLELNKGHCSIVIKDINNNLLQLTENARTFFPNEIPQRFSWGGKG